MQNRYFVKICWAFPGKRQAVYVKLWACYCVIVQDHAFSCAYNINERHFSVYAKFIRSRDVLRSGRAQYLYFSMEVSRGRPVAHFPLADVLVRCLPLFLSRTLGAVPFAAVFEVQFRTMS